MTNIICRSPCRTPQGETVASEGATGLVGERGGSPLILSSAHSGAYYPQYFLNMSQQSFHALRLNEDCYVDVLARTSRPEEAPLLYATFPRSFCDVNRACWDLDPTMFTGEIPYFVQATEKAMSGFGSIPRCVGENRPIYEERIPFMEAAQRIRSYWLPFHGALIRLIQKAYEKFGFCLIIDLHSMPDMAGENTPDFILGTRFGQSCSHLFVDLIEETLLERDYYVVRNYPYAGGYITRHYGRPFDNIHVLQLEIRRTLYMNTKTYQLRRRSARRIEDILRRVFGRVMRFLRNYYDD